MNVWIAAFAVILFNEQPSYFCRLFSPENLPNIALVLVGIIGILVAIRTLDDLKTQTAIAGKAANAALRNAEAVINAERPWIIVTAKMTEYDSIDVVGEIQGRTPANIISGWGNHLIVPSKSNLPDEPPYGLEGIAVEHQFLAVPGRPPFSIYLEPVSTLRLGERWEKLSNGDEHLFVFGRVVYTDMLTTDSDEKPILHETRWCFQLILTSPPILLKSGKHGYNRYT